MKMWILPLLQFFCLISLTLSFKKTSSFYSEKNRSLFERHFSTHLNEYEYTTAIPLTPNIILKDEYVYQIFWLDDLKKNDYFIICAEGDDLEMYFLYGVELFEQKNYIIYDGIGFSNSMGTLADLVNNYDQDKIVYFTSKSGCFTIQNTNGIDTYVTMLFRMANKQSIYCTTGYNIFQRPGDRGSGYSHSYIQLSASKNEECEMIILSKSPYCISCSPLIFIEIISGESNNYKFKDAMNGKALMQINNTDVNQWKNILVYTNALSITFTNSTSIYLTYIHQNTDISNINVFLSTETPIQKGIFAPPSYDGLPDSMNDVTKSFYNIASNKTMALNLVVKTVEQSVKLVVDGDEYPITKSTMLFGKSFQLFPQNNSFNNFLIEYSMLNMNKNTHINLNTDLSTHILWLNDMDVNDMITVCSPESDKLELFVPIGEAENNIYLSNFLLYDGSDVVGSLTLNAFIQLSESSLRQITSSSECLRLYKTTDAYSPSIPLLFRLKYVNSRGCSTSNVFVSSSSFTTNITARASGFGNCEIILLAPQVEEDLAPVIYIPSIRSSTKDIITMKSTKNQNKLAEFSGFDAIDWKDLYFYTPALSIIIAKETTIVFEMISVIPNQILIQNLTEYQQGVVASYAFNGFEDYPSNITFLNNNCGINFNVNYLADGDDVIMEIGNKSHTLKSNDNFTTYEKNLKISSTSKFLISYGIFNCSSPATTTDPNITKNESDSTYKTIVILLFTAIVFNLEYIF